MHYNIVAFNNTLPRGRREQTTDQKVYTICKNVKFIEIHYSIIRNHHEECLQISTKMSSIGFVIPEITHEML